MCLISRGGVVDGLGVIEGKSDTTGGTSGLRRGDSNLLIPCLIVQVFHRASKLLIMVLIIFT